MSINNKDKKATKDNSQSLILILLAIGCVLVGFIIGYFVSDMTSGTPSDIADNSENTTETTGNGITTYEYEHELLEGEQKESAINDILNVLVTRDNKPTYIEVQVDEESYEYYVYNASGECFVQTSDAANTELILSNHNAISLDADNEEVISGTDIEILSILKNVFTLAKEDREDVDLYFMPESSENKSETDETEVETTEDAETIDELSETSDNVVEYRVDIKSEQAFKDIYNMLDEELGDKMVESIKSSGPNIRFSLYLHNTYKQTTNEFGAICYVVQNESEYTVWYMPGCSDINDWEVPNEWYETENLNYSQASTLTESLVAEINEVLHQFAVDQGWVDEDLEISSDDLDTIEDETNTVSENDITNEE